AALPDYPIFPYPTLSRSRRDRGGTRWSDLGRAWHRLCANRGPRPLQGRRVAFADARGEARDRPRQHHEPARAVALIVAFETIARMQTTERKLASDSKRCDVAKSSREIFCVPIVLAHDNMKT